MNRFKSLILPLSVVFLVAVGCPKPAFTQEPTSSGTDELKGVASEMKAIGQLIARDGIGEKSRQRQKAVLEKLKRMLAATAPAANNSARAAASDSNKSNSNTTGTDATSATGDPRSNNPGTGEPGNGGNGNRPAAKELVQKVWGNLPDRVRQRMPGNMKVEFLPKYRHVIERYFQRLAESGSQPPRGDRP